MNNAHLQKYLAISLLILTIISASMLFNKFFIGRFNHYKTTLSQVNLDLARAQSLLSQAPAVEARMREIEQNNTNRDQLLPETNRNQAESNLQANMKRLLENNGGQVTTIQILPAEMLDNGLVRVNVRAQAVIQPKELESVIRNIELATPFLFVEQLRLNMRQFNNVQQRTTIVNGVRQIENAPSVPKFDYGLDISVSGYIRPLE